MHTRTQADYVIEHELVDLPSGRQDWRYVVRYLGTKIGHGLDPEAAANLAARHMRYEIDIPRCACHPECGVGLGEPCLNCGLVPHEHRWAGYCRNATRQHDWYTHRLRARAQ